MANLETSYQPLLTYQDAGEETPQDNVIIHVVPESGKARWNHIEDLDSFFTRVYQYHQKHGFTCMMLQELLELVQFIFVVLFSTFLLQCVEYPVLFKEKIVNNATTKVSLSDAVVPIYQCVRSLNASISFCLTIAFLFWLLRVVKVVYHFFQFLEIKSFYITALKINEADLDNMTWHEVQRKMQEVQKEQQMCIHKQELTELDIYHRILRFKNYMVAMTNKQLLPLKFRVPFLGEYVFLTEGLKYNLELILFWGPWAPFENSWHLKEDYKKGTKRLELAETLSKRILWIGIANFVLCPLILLWQILYSFFNYAEVIKREPGSLGARRWSLYGRLYLRHFNELDHELNARLNRGYRPASKYMSIFTSHVMVVVAKNVAFFAGAIVAVLLILTIYDEDLLQVEHLFTTLTTLGVMLAICRGFMPDENLVWCPEKLMISVLAHIHYMPDHWKGNSHTTRVRDEFVHLFQYKAVYLLEELLSPIITPIILCFFLRHKALDIVDFYHNFTVEVVGVGDVCSFALMDVKKHGNPQWMSQDQTQANQFQQAEDGKTELSLMHFKLTNPDWKPPAESAAFLANLHEQAQRDADTLHLLQEENPLYYSLHSMSSLGAGYSSLVSSVLRNNVNQSPINQVPSCNFQRNQTMRGGVNRLEGPVQGSSAGLLSSIHSASGGLASADLSSLQTSAMEGHTQCAEETPGEFTAADMSFSALYMHELHHRQCKNQGYADLSSRSLWHRPHRGMSNIQEMPQEEEEKSEKMPLLEPRASR